PRHAEDDLALRLADTLDQRIVGIIRMLGDHAAEALQNFADRLVEFILTRVALQDFGQDRLELLVNLHHATSQYSYGGGVVGEANADALETTPSRGNTEKRAFPALRRIRAKRSQVAVNAMGHSAIRPLPEKTNRRPCSSVGAVAAVWLRFGCRFWRR